MREKNVPKWSRRSILRAAAGMATWMAENATTWAGDGEQESLGQLAAGRGLLFGAAMMRDELAPASAILFAREVRLITPSNELKMMAVRPSRDGVDFSGADALIAFADKHRMLVRGHTLVWNEFQPEWINALSKRELKELIDNHVDLLCSRYRGRVHSWDVVNEPLRTERSERDWLSGGPYFDTLGPAYIARSLRSARAGDPGAKLLINETHTERDDAFGLRQRKRLLRLIDELQHAGVPLDGIGLQGHLDPAAPFNPDAFLEFCQEIASRGLEVQITELDVNDSSFPDTIAERDALVAVALGIWRTTTASTTAKRCPRTPSPSAVQDRSSSMSSSAGSPPGTPSRAHSLKWRRGND
jgi:endo-1,4-beta-xylanase